MTGLYLTAIFLGAATLAILVTLYLNREDPFTRSLAIGMVFCLIAITTATFYFKDYVPGAESSGEMMIVTMLIDILSYIVVLFWIHTTNILNGEKTPVPAKAVLIVLAAMGISYETAFFFGAHKAAFAAALLFGAVTAVCGVYFIIRGARKSSGKNVKRALIISGAGLAVYGMQFIDTERAAYAKAVNGTLEAWSHGCIPVMIIVFEVIALAYFFYADPAGVRKGSEDAAAEVSLKDKYELTGREEEIALLILQGLSNPQIAEETFISENTVKKHLTSIYKKTGTKGRYDLIAKLQGKE